MMGTVWPAFINRIYEVALDPSLWQPLLQDVARLIDAKECAIVFHDRLDRTRNAVFAASSSIDTIHLFLDEFIDLDDLSSEIVDSDNILYEDVLGEAREFHEQLAFEVKCGCV